MGDIVVRIHEVPLEERTLARAEDADHVRFIELTLMKFPWDDAKFEENTFFNLKERIMDFNGTDRIYNTFWEAAIALKSMMDDKVYRKDGNVFPIYPVCEVAEEFKELWGYMDEYEYEKVEERYGQGNPWVGPRMKIKEVE